MLERNRYYRGQRPHHVDRFVADLHADVGTMIIRIASGEFDSGLTFNLGERASELRQRYGSQLFVRPANELRMFVLNTSRPLFKNNPSLRKAVNFAVDRKAVVREIGPLAGTATATCRRPSPVTERAHLPAQRSRPSHGAQACQGPYAIRESRSLHNRPPRGRGSGAGPPAEPEGDRARGRDRAFPRPLFFEKLAGGGKDFDIGRIAWTHSPDPSWFAGIFDGRTIGQAVNQNLSNFNSRRYNRLFDEASRLTGNERYRAYGKLDLQLSRDAAPAIPIANLNAVAFVSARVGCVVMNPYFDLTAVCLK